MASDKRRSGRLDRKAHQQLDEAAKIQAGILPVKKYGLTFGYNAKCACSFVKRWWFSLCQIQWNGSPDDVHGTLIHFQSNRRDLFIDDPAHYHIAFIRNPLERLRSAYAEKVGNPHNKAFYIRQGLSFNEWIETLLLRMHDQEDWDEHWRPQSIQLQAHSWNRFVDIGVDLKSAVRSIEGEFKLPEIKYDHVQKVRMPKPAVTQELLPKVLEICRTDYEFFDQNCPKISEKWQRGPVAEEDYVSKGRTADQAEAAAASAEERPPQRQLPTDGKRLTIGMATFDDYDGVYFTVQAIHLYHQEVVEEIEFLVVDNNPDGVCAEPLRKLADWIPGYRYLPCREMRGTAVRDLIFREARTPYVMCVDSHVLLVPGSLSKLLAYFDRRPECRDLLQGPIVYDDLQKISTHFSPAWSHGMYGVWATDDRGLDPEGEPFEIPMQGLGLFACRRDSWQGFNPRFLGFGGEEGYIHEKFRRAGHRTLCLPFLRWLHRFARPAGQIYPNSWNDRVRNYLIGFHELGLDASPAIDHFREHVGAELVDPMVRHTREEIENPFFEFDAIYCLNLDSATGRWEAIQRRFQHLGIARRVRRFSAIETPESHHVGCALSHRAIVETAERMGWRNVLVIEDDAIFLGGALDHLRRIIAELKTQDWDVFHMGGHKWGAEFPKAPGCSHLRSPCWELTCTQVVAYNRSVFPKILADLPPDLDGIREWIKSHHAIDIYLRGVKKRYLSDPSVASQPTLLAQEDPEYRDRYTLGDPQPESQAPLTSESALRLHPDVEVTLSEDKLILSDPRRGQFLTLNPTAAAVIGVLDGERSVAQVKSLLQETYPEAAEVVARDVEQAIATLLPHGVLVTSAAANE